MREFDQRMRERIEKELADVNRRIAALKKEPRSMELQSFGDTTPITEEVEAIQLGEEREIVTEVLSTLLDRAAALDEARHRIDQGLYGVCVTCQRAIPRKRLNAVPEAAFCADCEQSLEARGRAAEPNAAEWLSAAEYSREKEKFDETGFETQQPRPQDDEGIVSRRRPKSTRAG